MNFVTFVVRQFGKYKLLFSIFLFSAFIEVAYAVASPLSLKYLVDEAFEPRNFQVFLLILGILVVTGAFNVGVSILGDYSIGKLSGGIIQNLRSDLFQHLQKQSLPFYQRYKVGDLVHRFSTDMSSMERVIRGAFPFFIKEGLNVIFGLTILFTLEWKLTLTMVIGSVLMFVGPKLLQNKAESDNVRLKEVQEDFANTVDEMIKGHKTIKSFYQQSSFWARARKQIDQLFTFGFRMHLTNSLMERLPLTALLILNGTMIGFGGYLIFQNHMTIGDFVAFLTLFMSVGQAGTNLTYLIPGIIDSNVSFRRISELFNKKPSINEINNPVELPSPITSIKMEDVLFGYNDDSSELKGVNLEIAAGSHVAFVGPSGSGKSTALQLISRFYDPKEGSVLFNGYDLRNVSEASLRKHCLLVTQDTFLFNATVRENLLLDNVDLSDEEMMEAAREANIHDTITSWKSGYETMIYHEGASLSGGERQRLAVARALLRKPNVILFDEVTSALDPVTESDVNQLIQDKLSGTTVISVTHRLASVVHMDQIVVFKDGRIHEVGTHQELIQNRDLYYQLWEKQNGFKLSEDGLHATVEVKRLAKIPFFEGIEPKLLKNIAALFSTETCEKGESIIREGERGNKFYLIVRGKVEVLKKVDEEEKSVAVLQDGDHFGEIALLKNIPRTATVRAMIPSIVLSVRREAFHQITEEHPQILKNLKKTLEQRS